MKDTKSDSGNAPETNPMNVEERILQVPEHFRGDVLATLYGPRGRIAKSIKKVQNADILDRTAEARKQAWSLGHFSKGNREADTLILDALLAAFFKCECINETSKEFLEMLEESLTNGAAAELGDRR